MIVKSNDEQIVMGVVYPSMVSDTDTDFTGPEGNWQAYWNILQKAELPKIDVYHDGNAIDARVVRLFVTLDGDPDFPPNNLVAMVKIGDVNVWADVKKGVLNGFSLKGDALSEKGIAQVERPIKASGTTELSMDEDPFPPHDHDADLQWDENNLVIPTNTGVRLGHSHPVDELTATGAAVDHAHRLLLNQAA